MSEDRGEMERLFRENEALRSQVSALEVESRLFRAFFDNAPIGKSMTAPDGTLLRVNAAFGAMLGYSLEEMQRISFASITHPEDVVESRECVRALLAGERDTWVMEKRYLAKDGRHVWTHVTTRLQRDDQRRPLHFLTHVLDITDRKRIEERIEQRTAELKESQRALVEAQKVARVGGWEWEAVKDEITGSEEFYRLFDVAPDGLARFSQFVERLHPDDRERVRQDVADALKQDRPYDTDYRVKLRDGGWRDINARGRVVADEHGKALRMLGTCLDITERKRAELALRDSEERSRATLRSIGDGVISTDASGRVVQMNPVAESLSSWGEAAAVGQPLARVFRIVNEHTRAEVESPVDRVLREGVVVGLANHTLLIAKDGTEHPIADSGAPIRDTRGEMTGVVLVFRDQTEERAAQRALQESERWYRTLAESLPHLVWTCRADGPCDYLSPRWIEYTGIPEADQLGYGWLQQLHPGDRERVIAEWSEIAPRGGFFDIEFRIRRADGAYRWFKTRAIPFHDNDGRVVKWFGSNTDVDDHKRAEQDLRKHRDELERRVAERTAELEASKALVDETSKLAKVGGWEIDLEKNELFWTDVVCEIHEVEPGFRPTVGAAINFYAPEAVPVISEAVRRAIEGGQPYDLELQLITAKKNRIWVRAIGEAIRENGRITKIRGVFQEINQRKLAEIDLAKHREYLRDRTAQLEETNKELEAFSYSVSHDLRAPLRAIDGFTRILADDFAPQLNAEGKRVCSVIRENTGKMGRLIDDLLAFSRLGRTEIQPSTIDMGAMAKAVFYELTTPESRERIDFQVGPLPAAVGDPSLMRQVWMNLLGNAVKFSSKCERAVIEVSAEMKGGELVYAVRDNGAGFDMQYVHKLFGVFQRLHGMREFEGTGVGLALVQRIIRRHGGRVWAEGETDRGATFHFAMTEKGS